jgi:hypothetical protein
MPNPKLVSLMLSGAGRKPLEALVRERTASQSLAQRAQIVLACAEGPRTTTVTAVAAHVARGSCSRGWTGRRTAL